MSNYWNTLPGRPTYPPRTQWFEDPREPQNSNFHDELYQRYGAHYPRHPEAVFQYNGGWAGTGGAQRYQDWQMQWLDMQGGDNAGGVEPGYGGFVHGDGRNVWWGPWY
ncbi:hypothetical protein TI39_contig4202g00019 [Zymoseptoria brevis]|uniref:Uncharacterized protein n=1 Tax=Zymoseptoria brevis TaxID=1047168 RepID=A0A0F4GBH1_9PEZI|nr:hypothetical protein TI39_contig4202g00019 [Zymoseptoria brevis]